MKRLVTALVATGMSIGLVGVSATTAGAADSVSIRKLGSYSVTKGHKKTIKASVDARGNVRVGTPVMDVWNRKGKRLVVKKPRARLGAGTYKVRTYVKYRSYTMRYTYKNVVTHRKGATVTPTCSVTSVEPVVSPVTGVVDGITGIIPLLGEVLGGALGSVVEGVVPVYDYTASCRVGGSNPFPVSGTIAGVDSVDRSVITYPGSGSGLGAYREVGYGPANLRGKSVQLPDLVLERDVTRRVVATRAKTYSPIKQRVRTQTLRIRNR
jgi:hypothetical protein